jgi:hypothetical protein
MLGSISFLLIVEHQQSSLSSSPQLASAAEVSSHADEK